MAHSEDCGTVLEEWLQDHQNLPAEIVHLFEEVAAKDKLFVQYKSQIDRYDNTLQKQVKAHGSLTPHSKEGEYATSIQTLYDQVELVQDEKTALLEKAVKLMTRSVDRLDAKMKPMVKAGLLPEDAIPQPSRPIPFGARDTNSAALTNLAAHRLNQAYHQAMPNIAQPVPMRVPQISVTSNLNPRTSAPATPASAAVHLQQAQTRRERESSAGAVDSKRRRTLGPSLAGSMPSSSSNLRQSSLGPHTPGTTTPAARGSSAGPRSNPHVPTASTVKKPAPSSAAGNKKLAPHEKLRRMKAHAAPKGLKRTASGHPVKHSKHRPRGEDDEDSVLSSTENSSHRSVSEVPSHDADPNERDDDAGDDDQKYCFCQTVSYGDMVACENDACRYEWFHFKCVGITKAPPDGYRWYCSDCEAKGFKSGMAPS